MCSVENEKDWTTAGSSKSLQLFDQGNDINEQQNNSGANLNTREEVGEKFKLGVRLLYQ